MIPELDKMTRGRVIKESEIDAVQNFFMSDDVSRICPGANNFIAVRNSNGVKEKLQKRLILGTLSEIYEKFKENAMNPKIGCSSFSALRPRNCVLAGSAGTHAMCACVDISPKCEADGRIPGGTYYA